MQNSKLDILKKWSHRPCFMIPQNLCQEVVNLWQTVAFSLKSCGTSLYLRMVQNLLQCRRVTVLFKKKPLKSPLWKYPWPVKSSAILWVGKWITNSCSPSQGGAKLCIQGRRIRNTYVNLFYGFFFHFMNTRKLQTLWSSVLGSDPSLSAGLKCMDTRICPVVSPFTFPHSSAALRAEIFVSVSHLERCSQHREADHR